MYTPSDDGSASAVADPAALTTIVERIAETVAAAHAIEVDADARFPRETLEALRRAEALSAMVPRDLGGAGCSLDSIAEMCTTLGRHCSSSAMVFAMHQIQVATLIEERDRTPELSHYLERLVKEQRLIASMTSEIGTGGELRQSIAFAELVDGAQSTEVEAMIRFRKSSPTISYVEHADDLLVSLRRNEEAAASDQVLALALKDDYLVEDVGEWNTLGMRGTCSPPAKVQAQIRPWQILPTPFRVLATTAMVPASHILWAALWLGIALDAFDRARRLLQSRVRKDPDGQHAAATRLARVATGVDGLRAQLREALRDHARVMSSEDPEKAVDLAASLRINDLKLAASEGLVEIVSEAIQVCGIEAYRNDGEYSLGRHLRDAHSAPLMINNDRIRQTNADLLLVYKGR